MLEWRGEVLEDFRELGEFRLAGAERRRTFAFVAGQAIEHVHGVVGAALLAVIDDVEAAFGLLTHYQRHSVAHSGGEFGPPRAGLLLSASSSSTTLAVRGRLPVWVVRIRPAFTI